MATPTGREQFKQTYETGAIILFGGIAGGATNSLMIGTLSGGLPLTFVPIVGGSLVSNQVATFPLANQAVAANSIIQQPLKISIMMIAPADGQSVGYLSKSAAMTALVNSLNQHNNLGGVYSVVTPSYTYTNCLLTDMYDSSDGRSQQAQYQWRFDFMQPLLTLAAAQAAQNNLVQKLTGGNAQAASTSAAASTTSAMDTAGLTSDTLSSLTMNYLTPALTGAGISTSNLTSFVSSTVNTVVANSGSLSDLQTSLIAGLLPAAGQAGVAASTLQGLVTGALTPALNSVGLTPAALQQSVLRAMSSPVTSGNAPPTA